LSLFSREHEHWRKRAFTDNTATANKVMPIKALYLALPQQVEDALRGREAGLGVRVVAPERRLLVRDLHTAHPALARGPLG